LQKIKEALISIVDWPARYPDLFAEGKVSGAPSLRRYISSEGENHLDSILATPEQLQITMEDFLARRPMSTSGARAYGGCEF